MPRTADQILEESFLDVRAKLLEVAATLDRIDRAAEQTSDLSSAQFDRRAQVNAAIEICGSDSPRRAEQLQQLFSRPYQVDWRKTMQL
ncbi:hypothetical protein [Rubripirellula reticaptiva]|uniref:Uncharacterized protein n=1 Tax=Rubripirellula reticaptiva TaxID=2528013 RepID=A0A5C6EQ47_9BACT|nr:hypothetical protein [Rubripirellula reticaptiva]TWU49681.1 hypothetical protein Poly59_43030 [Rubripirellula reticaptiva]